MRLAHRVRNIEKLDAFLIDTATTLHAQHPTTPGVQWAVAHGHRILAEGAIGLADTATREPLKTQHALQAASNAKPLGAVAAAVLSERGKLDLDAPLRGRLSDWKPRCATLTAEALGRLTLRKLLSHTSGLGVRGYPQVPWRDPAPPSAAEILDGWFGPEFATEFQPILDPAKASYSGAGYTLAQLALESATGDRYAELIEGLVIRPLRLKRLWIGRRMGVSCPIAAQHDEHAQRLPRTFYPALAASGLYASATDLARFYAGFDSLLGSRTFEDALRPHGEADKGWMFGLGFALADSNGTRTCKHAGWSTGCWGAAEGIPDRKLGACVLCNGAAGKEIAMPLLGAAVQWLTTH